jgi:hypothetical protein
MGTDGAIGSQNMNSQCELDEKSPNVANANEDEDVGTPFQTAEASSPVLENENSEIEESCSLSLPSVQMHAMLWYPRPLCPVMMKSQIWNFT